MKKILSVLLALLLLVSAVPVGAMAAEAPTITAEYTAGEEALKKGDKVEVAFRIANNPGINGATFELKYDAKVLEFSGLKTQVDDYDEEEIVGLFKKGLCTWYTKTNRIAWAADSNITKDNILFWAVFDVVGCGDVTVTADVLELVDSTVNPNVQYGSTVTVNESETISVPSVAATEVTLNKTELSMYPGETQNLTATVVPENSTDEIVWSTSNPEVALVRDGRITALQAGTTTITAKANDSVSATCEVTVKNHVHMKKKSGDGDWTEVVGYSTGASKFNYWYNGTKYTMTPNDVYVFDVTGTDAVKFGFDDSNFKRTGVAIAKGLDGVRIDELFFNYDAVTQGKEFAISDLLQYGLVSYAEVSKAFGDNLPKLNISAEDAFIFLCYQDQSYVSSQYGILMKIDASALTPATKVELDKSELTLKLGVDESAQLTANVTPENTTDKLSWSSDKESVATVDENGKVTPVAAGTATITATAGNQSASCTVTVTKPTLVTYKENQGNHLKHVAISGVDIEYATDWVDDGTNVTTTVVLPADTKDGTKITNDFMTYQYNWAYYLKQTAVEVTLENGRATAQLVYTPELNTERDSRTYIVNYILSQNVNSVTLDKSELTLIYGGTDKLTATVDPEALQRVVKWTSSAPDIVSVDASGKLKALASGTAVITATAMDKSATCTVTVPDIFSATNIPYLDSQISMAKILVLTDATIESSAWEGDTLNITMAEGTVDGTNATVEFHITAPFEKDYNLDGVDVTMGDRTVTALATIANGEATVTCSVQPCGCGESEFDIAFAGKTYTVHFTVKGGAVAPSTHTVTIAETTNGKVTADKTTAAKDDTVTLTVTPADGYKLDTLTVKSGDTDIPVTEKKFTMPDGDVTVTATFAEEVKDTVISDNMPTLPIGLYVESITVSGVKALDYAWDGDTLNIQIPATTAEGTSIGAKIATHAISSVEEMAHYMVNGNTKKVLGDPVTTALTNATLTNGEATIEVVITPCTCGKRNDTLQFESKTYTLHFTTGELGGGEEPTPTTHTVTIAETTNGKVTADKSTAAKDEVVTLTVTPDDGYKLDTLTVKSGDTSITVTDNKFTMPDGDVTVTATFVAEEPEVPATSIIVKAVANVDGTVKIVEKGKVDFGDYTDVPYQNIQVPKGTTSVDVTFVAGTDFYNYDNTVYSYKVVLPDMEQKYGPGCAMKTNDDGTITVTIPLAKFAYENGEGYGIALEATDFAPVNLMTFEQVEATEPTPPHTCVFNQKNTDSKFLKSEATCESPAVYYYSCTCGEMGTETFTSGDKADHVYEGGVCTGCGQADPSVSQYTVALGEDKNVSAGETVEIPVTIGHTNASVTTYNAFDLIFTYDPAVLKLDMESEIGLTITDNNGTLRILRYGEDLTVGEVAFTLKFTALTAGEAKLTATSALVGISEGAITGDANKAAITGKETNVTVDGYTVNLPEDFTGESTVQSGESYTFTAKDTHYTYEVSATMGGEAVKVTDNGDGTFTIANVTGNLVITTVSKTQMIFNVTLEGEGLTGPATAKYNETYTATLTKESGYTYEIKVTIGGKDASWYASGNDICISGSNITGDVKIVVTRTAITPSTYAVTFEGNAAGDASGASSVNAKDTYTFTVNKTEGATYTITATMGGKETTVTETETGYAIANVTGNLVIKVEKQSEITVEVSSYLELNGKTMFLVKAKGTLAEGYAYAYDGTPMFKSNAYDGSWVYLVMVEEGTLTADDAKAKITSAQATFTTLEQTYDVNETGKVDVNDAQLVYDLYNTKYQDFTAVSMQKFLKADTNADGKVDVNDAVAIVNEINNVR